MNTCLETGTRGEYCIILHLLWIFSNIYMSSMIAWIRECDLQPWTQWNHQAPFCGFLIFLIKKGKWVKLYVWIHTIARSKEHVPMSSEWYLDIFNSTYFDVFMNFVDQKVFKKTIINQKHDFHGQFLVVIRIWSICYAVERSRCLVRAYLQNTITIGVEFEHCEQLAKSIQIDQI